MKPIQGLLTIAQLHEAIDNHTIETVVVAFTDHYGRMVGKRFDADFFVESVQNHGTHSCNYLLTTNIEMSPVAGYNFANWELGYGDFHLVPDFSTLRVAAWLPNTAMVLCDLINEKSHQLIEIAPRSIFKKILQNAKNQGFETFTASELEYYLFENTYRQAHQQHYADLKPVGWYVEDYHILQGTRTEPFHAAVRKYLKLSGVPVENSKGEWGLGQHELNVRYAEALVMADRHVVYKQCLKESADAMGISVTFMAKFAADCAGSSCHIHISLWQNGHNAFDGHQPLGPVMCSDVFRWFLGGCIAHAPEVMVFYAPTVNAYKRYVDGSWAPTRLAWSYDNRTAGFRVVGSGQSLRIECRIPGADCNPYLAFAALLASGLDGIKNQTEPPAIFEGDIYAAAHLPRVPYTLAEATELFINSDFVKQTFGKPVVDHYAHFYKTEQKEFNTAVTDWERKRYFEQI
jgi:glutamine synthetase